MKIAFDNFTLSNGKLLCPSITLNPLNGTIGTKVTVQGSGFPAPRSGYAQITSVDVSFDDMFLGFTTVTNGNFTFTFSIPLAQSGTHLVKAQDALTGTLETAPFQVLSTSTQTLALSITTGTIYFPGDTAIVFGVLTTGGTAQTPPTLQLQLTLYKPDGTHIQLNATSTVPGLFQAKYSIPKTGSLGTYTIVCTAQTTELGNGTALAGFEVKSTWLSQQGPLAVSALAVAGLGTVALVAWKKPFRNRNEPSDRVSQH